MSTQQPAMHPTPSRKLRGKRKRSSPIKIMLYVIVVGTLLSVAGLIWFFLTESGTSVRYMMADTLITTQHRDWAKYLIGSEELQTRVENYWKKFEEMGEEKDKGLVEIKPEPSTKVPVKKELVKIDPISGKNFKGYLVTISDPKKLRIAVPNKVGKGEKVTSMVKRTGAILGVNGGGFIDPEWKGNGFQPEGVVISGGKIFYNDRGANGSVQVVGIDKDGRMIAGKYKVSELLSMGVKEAVSFSPRFIVNGVGQIKSQADGWGIAPRTCMAQTKDGSILFAVIDGRQTHSIGATLYDVQKIFLEHGAVTAANLDGGSSSVLVHNNEIVNQPSSEYGERYLPTAWLVFDDPEHAQINNIWEGLDISKIDPSKW
ncbi:phosphodiester glycosidase family protein [Paenibacillus hexagrammi]|uniref:Phosphodiester glycosidase family protein n=1 Tax=Paenibacillus hexagrammi TaxID=2908839 RepID=A0ABY3SEJ2_9BACL|nr:phosphodiester glycosidase family protein [Paenibacillus sp. YPD9-1]UJF31659.1 phosphodiester glycosidase family protein [Paenibacillus sp. YPD9-1]